MMNSSQNTALSLILFVLSTVTLGGTYSGGLGTEAEPYQLQNATDWQELTATESDWSQYFILVDDINLVGQTITPVENFSGFLDGVDHVISNVSIHTPGLNFVGLFGQMSPGGQIKNLNVEDISIIGYDYVGGLVGDNAGILRNCNVTGSVTGDWNVGILTGSNNEGTIICCSSAGTADGGTYVGGLAGDNFSGTISDSHSTGSLIGYGDSSGGLTGADTYGMIERCSATGSVNGQWYTGGLIGDCFGSSIINCSASGSVDSIGNSAGGLVGRLVDSSVDNCYALGSVESLGEDIGGLIGENWGTINQCYSIGSTAGSDRVGGIAGSNNSGIINSSFWNTETSNIAVGVGNEDPDPSGVMGRTTAQMKTQSNFTAFGWVFVSDLIDGTESWRMCQDGVDYPHLIWEYSNQGDFVCPVGVDMGDFLILSRCWDTSYGQGGFLHACDLNKDDIINILDLIEFSTNWLVGI